MLYKKRWSDGLHDDFEHLDEFELKFGLFGGDGGGGGGGGSSSSDTSSQNARAAAQEPARGRSTVSAAPATGFRGEQSAAAEGMRAAERAANAALDRASAAERVEQMVNRAVFDSGFYDTPKTQTAPGLREMAPTAFDVSQPTVAPSRPSALDSVSFTPDIPTTYDMPTFSDYMNMIDTPQMNVPDIPTSPATGLMDSVRGLNQFDIGPGTLSINPEIGSQGLTGGSIEYSVPLGGGLSSLQNTGNPMVDAIIGGMNNAAANPAPATTDLAFTDTFTNVFGTLTSPVERVGNNLVRSGNTYTSAGTGGITSTRREPSMYEKVTSTGRTLADQVGLGSLFN